MDGTADRTRKIRKIVTRHHIATQTDLVAALRREGIRVTQATVSRDMKRLGLIKIPAPNGRYRYALPGTAPEPPRDAALRLRSAFAEFAVAVERGLDLVLVKTVPGGASPVAEAIDEMRWPDVAGTVAGENTVIIVPRRRRAARAVMARLHRMVPR